MAIGFVMRDLRSGDSNDSGMTLVEMLIVLTIIAVTTSISVLAIGSDDGLRGRAEAKRLEARLQLAADQVMIGDRSMAIAIAPQQYAFMERNPQTGAWIATDDPVLGESFTLPNDMTLSTAGTQPVLPLDAGGAGRPFSLLLQDDGRSWIVTYDGVTARLAPAPPPS